MPETPATVTVKVKPEITGLDSFFRQLDFMSIFGDIQIELRSAEAKHGDQLDTPFGFDLSHTPMANLYRNRCQDAFKEGLGTWMDILLEEVYELSAEEDPKAIYAEAIQVAAMAMKIAEKARREMRSATDG